MSATNREGRCREVERGPETASSRQVPGAFAIKSGEAATYSYLGVDGERRAPTASVFSRALSVALEPGKPEDAGPASMLLLLLSRMRGCFSVVPLMGLQEQVTLLLDGLLGRVPGAPNDNFLVPQRLGFLGFLELAENLD